MADKLLIKNAKNLGDEKIEILIEDGKITEIAQEIKVEDEITVLDLEHKSYVSAGWIDCHVHGYEGMDLYSDDPDLIGIQSGVTTIIDAGTTGADDIADFEARVKDKATNVFAMMNISRVGLKAQDELSKMENIDEVLFCETYEKHSDFIVGVKARMSKTVIGDNGIAPLKKAVSLRKQLNLPLMVHIGSNPPELSDILSLLGSGDIVTHCFNGKPNGIADKGTNKIKDFVTEAYKKGIILDVGHGTDSFNFEVANLAFNEGIIADSISSDIYKRNRVGGPVYNLATTMEKLMCVGYTLEEVIEKVTSAPAEIFNLHDKGRLEIDCDGDLTIFDVVSKDKELVDSNGNKETTGTCIVPRYAIVGGKIHECELS